MLSRSLPEQVRRHLERITRAKTVPGAVPPPQLIVPLKHETASLVLQAMQGGLTLVHPEFSFRHFYDPASINPETIAYWLVELAQQTRENFCWYVDDIPPPEHYGQCAAHHRQIAALFEAFVAGIADNPIRSEPLKVYKDRMSDLLGEGARNQRQEIDRFVRNIEVGDEAGQEVRQAIAENLRGQAYFIFTERNAGSH